MKLSIISLNYNRLEFTKLHLENLINTTDVECELIVVSNSDNKRSRQVREHIKQSNISGGKVKKVIKVLNHNNYGVAGGRNSGLVYASGEFKIVIDDDIIMPENWATKIITLLEGIEKVGVAGYCVEKDRAAKKYKIKTYNDTVFQSKGRDNIGGACLMISPKTFKKLGYFCEDYETFGFEDADYGSRVAALGMINAYVYPERAEQMKDIINNSAYFVWKKSKYNSKMLRSRFEHNLNEYANRRNLYIGKKRLKKKENKIIISESI